MPQAGCPQECIAEDAGKLKLELDPARPGIEPQEELAQAIERVGLHKLAQPRGPSKL